MSYVMLGVWAVQAWIGVTLFRSWIAHGRGHHRRAILTHAALMFSYLVPWTLLLVTGSPVWAWIAVAVLTVGIPFGETLMVARSRRLHGAQPAGLRDYGTSISDVFGGRMPRRVAFHALYSAAVYFGSLGVAIALSIAHA